MRSITIDDRRPIVNIMLRILNNIDPDGEHIGTNDPDVVIEEFGKKKADVIFSDVEMPKMNGIELAKKLQQIDEKINIVFITGFQEYMPEAFDLYASGYLLKPVDEDQVRKALAHLRYEIDEVRPKIRVQCFGNFEVFADGVPMNFRRSKSKELFAYLIDRKGSACTNDMIIGNLWPDKPVTDSLKSLQRTVVAEMIRDFEAKDIKGLFLKNKNGISVNMDLVDCDYYHYLSGDKRAINQFKGEYMTQYEFAQETLYHLLKDYE